jgi:predicted nucleic acid-binding protein
VILYLDTSSLVKLYLEEDGRQAVRSLVGLASVVATSVIAYPEARSAFARVRREGGLTDEELGRVKGDFERDWSSYLTLRVTDGIWRHAGELTEAHALRGFDSLHLASYLALATLDLTQKVEFSAFDQRLNEAARAAAI